MHEDMIDGQPMPASARFAGHPCPWPENRHDLSQAVRAVLARSRLMTAEAIAAVAALHEDGIL